MVDSPALWLLAVIAITSILYYVLRLALEKSITTAIRLNADKQLEQIKSELNSKLEALRHEYQLNQLRASLFFEPQRAAFAEILAVIAEVKKKWFDSEYEQYQGIKGPVPNDQYEKLVNIYYKHQLFLDTECLVAVELVLDALRLSFPFDNGQGGLHPRNCDAAYERFEYIQPRVAEIFQEKIGFESGGRAKQKLALLGSISLLNSYHFTDIGLPVKGSLKLDPQDQPADAVSKAADNRTELINKLKEFEGFLSKGHGTFHQAESKIRRYLDILEINIINTTQENKQ